MERQIVNGERIGAAARAVASQPRMRPAATPAPAAVQREIPGEKVTAIGDSVMGASAMALEAVLPGIYIDARPSRQMPAGLSVVRKLRISGQLRAVVVVGLGTNYIEWSKEVNATMAAFVHRHPAVVLADWFDTIRHPHVPALARPGSPAAARHPDLRAHGLRGRSGNARDTCRYAGPRPIARGLFIRCRQRGISGRCRPEW